MKVITAKDAPAPISQMAKSGSRNLMVKLRVPRVPLTSREISSSLLNVQMKPRVNIKLCISMA